MAHKILVFDFDGTIADILEIAPLVANKVFESVGMPQLSRKEMEKYRSMTISQGIRSLGVPLWKIPRMIRESRQQLHIMKDHVKPIKGMPELIRELDKNKDIEAMYILTSNSPENVEVFLSKHKLTDCFEEVVAGLNLFNKPAKLKSLVKRHNYDPSYVHMIGDESRDMEAGNKVGTNTIAVTWGLSRKNSLRATKPDHIVDSVDSLRKVLK